MFKTFNPKVIGLLALIIIAGIAGFYAFTTTAPEPLPTTPAVATKAPKTVGVLLAIGQRSVLYDGFKEGMTELGYVEGDNIIYDFDLAMLDLPREKQREGIEKYARKYVREDVDLIYTIAGNGISAALDEMKSLDKEIPIVFVSTRDPVGQGFVESYESSGNNITGIATGGGTDISGEIEARKLEFLKQINPNAKKLGLFTKGFMIPEAPGANVTLPELKKQVSKFGLSIVEYTTNSRPGPGMAEEFQRIVNAIQPGDVDALYHLRGHFVPFQEEFEAKLSIRLGIPYILASLSDEAHLESLGLGGTFSYFVSRVDIGKKAATMADKIFKGINPADIPIDFPDKNIVFINLDMAEKQGITIPDSMLRIADIIKK